MTKEAATAHPLDKLREAFPANQISKLPKEGRKQIDERKNRVQGCMVWNCPECGNAHHKDAVHLDYVGHAAATDRLLDTDIEWTWEPLALTDKGLPAFDENGGLWIKLTVCGVTRLGYGSADGKSGGDAKKEIIGDAIRNAGMRFGMALDLWHKGDLHAEEPGDEKQESAPERVNPEQELMLEDKMREAGVDPAKFLSLAGVATGRARDLPAEKFPAAMQRLNATIEKATKAKAEQRAENPQHSKELEDEIPY